MIILDFPDGPSIITMVLLRGKKQSKADKRDVMTEVAVQVMHFEDGGRGHRPRISGGL